jgi:hypothetical protein
MEQDREDFQDTYPVDFQPSRQPEPENKPPGEPYKAGSPRLRPVGSGLAFLLELATYRFS